LLVSAVIAFVSREFEFRRPNFQIFGQTDTDMAANLGASTARVHLPITLAGAVDRIAARAPSSLAVLSPFQSGRWARLSYAELRSASTGLAYSLKSRGASFYYLPLFLTVRFVVISKNDVILGFLLS
jgi:hypothetical protein